MLELGSVLEKVVYWGWVCALTFRRVVGSAVIKPRMGLVGQVSDEGEGKDIDMRKLHVLGLALVAVFAFSAFIVTAAFAEESQILMENQTILALENFSAEGFLLLEDTAAAAKINVLCSGILDGFIEPGGTLGYVTELLMLDGTLLNELGVLNGEGRDMIDCSTASSVCNVNKEEVLVTVNLDGTKIWHWEILLDLESSLNIYLLHFLNALEIEELLEDTTLVLEPHYEVSCLNSLLGEVHDLCEGLSSARLFVTGGGLLLAYFNQLLDSEAWGAESELTLCESGGENSGILESIDELDVEDNEASGGLITAASGLPLTLSAP